MSNKILIILLLALTRLSFSSELALIVKVSVRTSDLSIAANVNEVNLKINKQYTVPGTYQSQIFAYLLTIHATDPEKDNEIYLC